MLSRNITCKFAGIVLGLVFLAGAALPLRAVEISGSQQGAATATVGPAQILEQPGDAVDTTTAFDHVDWDKVKAAYDYDHSLPLNIEISEEKDMGSFSKIFFKYDSLDGRRVPAVLFMPKSRVKPMKSERSTVPDTYPVMFLMHFHVSDKSMADLFSTWPGHGVAIMAIDGIFRGERKEQGQDILMPDPMVSARNMMWQIQDIQRGFDALEQWKGIDPGRIGYMGVSMGAVTGAAATALDNRVKSILLADGAADFSVIFKHSEYGDVADIQQYMDQNHVAPEQLIEAFSLVDPAVFAKHLTDRPVMFMNGKTDTTMTVPAMNKLHAITPTPKKAIIWYDSGHILPFDKVVVDALKWFKGTL